MNVTSETPATPITDEVARLATATEDALARDFAVLACEPADKRPFARYAPHAVNSATKDKNTALKPYIDGTAANIGIACGASDLAVVDIDYGLSSAEALDAWMKTHNLPATLAVRTGKRTAFGVHLFYRGAIPSTTFELGGCKGEVKSIGGYVLGVGSVHPVSGARYEYLRDIPIVPLPEVFKNGKAKTYEKKNTNDTFQLVPASQRNARLTSLAGTLRNQHLSEDTIFAALRDFAINQCEDGESYFIQEEDKLKDMAHRAVTKFDAEPLTPIITIGKGLAPIPQGYCMTAEEWMAYDFSKEESDPIVGTATNAIVRPLTKNLIVAPDKSFKTTFLMRLMVGLAGGVTTFDELPVTRACRVVYFHCELNPTEVKQRIIASVINVDTHGQFFNVRDIRAHLIDAEGRQFILETLTAHKPDIVVLDPWQELISGYNENDQKDTSLARSFINILIETFRCTVFLVQHTGNDESKGGRGHSGMKGWRDTLIKLSRHGENGVHVIVEPRWGEKVTFDLTFKDGTLNPAVTVGFTSQQLELRSFLKEKYPTGATPQQIADGLEMTPDACKKMIQRALKDDAVIKNDAGLICLKVKDATPTKGEGQ